MFITRSFSVIHFSTVSRWTVRFLAIRPLKDDDGGSLRVSARLLDTRVLCKDILVCQIKFISKHVQSLTGNCPVSGRNFEHCWLQWSYLSLSGACSGHTSPYLVPAVIIPHIPHLVHAVVIPLPTWCLQWSYLSLPGACSGHTSP